MTSHGEREREKKVYSKLFQPVVQTKYCSARLVKEMSVNTMLKQSELTLLLTCFDRRTAWRIAATSRV